MKTKLFLLILFCVTLASQAQNKYTAELLQKLGRVSDPQISPDGKSVLYNVRWVNLEKNKGQSDLYKVDVATKAVTRLTNDDFNQSSGKWNATSTAIYFLSNADGSSQLYKMNSDGSNTVKISSIENGVDGYGISANEKRVWFFSEVKVEDMKGVYADLPKATGKIYDDLMYRHWTEWEDGNYSHVFTAAFDGNTFTSSPIDLMKGEAFDCPIKPNDGEENVAISSDGSKIAYSTRKNSGRDYAMSTNSDIFLYDVATGNTSNVTDGMVGYDKNPVFSPDGSKFIFMSQNDAGYEADKQSMFLFDLKTKAKTDLTKNFDYNTEQKVWSNDGKKIYTTVAINATEQIYVYDLAAKEFSYKAITSGDADRTSLSYTVAGKKEWLAYSRMDMLIPSEIYLTDVKTGVEVQLTTTNKEILAGVSNAKVEKRMIKSSDGKSILTWVIFPPDFDKAKKYPALLYCQGGPQSTVSQFFSFRWNFQLMAANGYIVVAPNRRGLPSFGEKWNDDIVGEWGGQAMDDLLSAIDSVSKETFVNKDKLGCVGASFGGYSAFWLAGHHNKRFKAFISHNGVYNLEAMNATEESFFNHHDFQGDYWNNPIPKSYTRYSPHRYVGKWDTPILIIANEKDYRVPYTQGLDAYNAARLRNIPASLLTYPDEGHWVMKPQNGVQWQRTFFDWLDKWLK